MASKGALVVRFIGDTKDLDRSFKKTQSATSKVAKLIGGVAIGSSLVAFFKSANAEAREAQKVGALTAQVIKSTGGAAKVSAKHVGDLSEAISRKAGIDDEAIQSGANLLLTFKQIRNEVGKGNAIFDRATRAAVDLSAAGFGDLTSTSKQLGKALNDPLKGITALTRSGVTFTEQQKDQIKKWVETGRVLKAQKMILREVESQVGGAAKAQATAADKAKVAWGNLKEQIGTGLLPTIDKAANLFANEVAPAVSKFVSGMQDGTGAGGDFADVLKDVRDIGKGVLSFVKSLPGPVKDFGAQAAIAALVLPRLTAGVTAATGAMGLQVARFQQLRAEMTYAETRTQRLSTAATAMGGALKQAAGVGGMLALYASTKQTDKGIQTFLTTAGGMATGFAVGGPIGAAIGGAGGLLLGLMQKTKGANDAFANTKPAIDYAASLNEITGAATKATRETIRLAVTSDKQLTAAMGTLGVSMRDVIDAQMGVPGSMKRIRSAIAGAKGELVTWTDAWGVQHSAYTGNKFAADVLSGGLRKLGKDMADDAKEVRDTARATQSLTKVYKGVPKEVRTQIKAMGTDLTRRDVVTLTGKYGLVPKQVATLLKANNLPATRSAIQTVIDKSREFDKQRPSASLSVNTRQANASLDAVLGRLNRIISRNWSTVVSIIPGGGGRTSGSRASGGPVMAGNIYRVNENGPEYFRPFTSGQVMTGTSVQKAASGVASVAPSGGDQVVEVHLHLEGETIVKQVKARNRRKGVPSAGI